ncbi:helix-turn-helix transcriptional regulator [Brachybacterium alimentarium]|uniref:helix-turn-helix transcriptional regulator n=1 Tax=Brachybacterium alimentarium TaxID=47845 RepID=UPI003FD5965C
MDQPQPLATIADRVGITMRTLRKHAERDGFPPPAVRCGKCGSGLLYDLAAVQRWEKDGAEVPTQPGGATPTAQPLSVLADELDITAGTLWKHSKLPGFPRPIARCGMCANAFVYNAEAVRRYEEGAPVDPSDRLVSLQEAADELELSYGSMRTYLGRHPDFPKPVKYTGPRPLFSLQQIHSWQDKRQRMRSTVAEASSGDTLEVEGLLTRAGVAAELGVELDTVTRYQRRDTDFSKDFPESVRKIGRSRLWDPQQVRAWRSSRPNAQRQA